MDKLRTWWSSMLAKMREVVAAEPEVVIDQMTSLAGWR